jgi:hypothetical protein
MYLYARASRLQRLFFGITMSFERHVCRLPQPIRGFREDSVTEMADH